MKQIDKRTQKIRDRIHFEIQRVLQEKNKEKLNPENSNIKQYKNYWLYDADIVYFQYIKKDERFDPLKTPNGRISDYSNIPYEDVIYSRINAVGKQWIRRYALALSKEMLGYVRGKYSALPIPNAEVTLNGSDLISAGQTEKEGLITELKETLDTMSRQAQLERKQAEADAMQQQFTKIPLKIYIG